MIQEKGTGEMTAAQYARGAAGAVSDKIDHVQGEIGAQKVGAKVDNVAGKVQDKVYVCVLSLWGRQGACAIKVVWPFFHASDLEWV